MGRLVDADALIKKIQEEKQKSNYSDVTLQVVNLFIEMLEEQPTAYDVETVDNNILEYFKGVLDKKPDGWDVVDFSCDVRRIVRRGGVDGC
jgi:hypothetical protein